MKSVLVSSAVRLCLAPKLLVSCEERIIPICKIYGLRDYYDHDGTPLTFTHLPLLESVEEDKFRLLHNANLWSHVLDYMPCSTIRAFVITERIDEIVLQNIKKYTYYIDSVRGGEPDINPSIQLYDKLNLSKLIQNYYPTGKDELPLKLLKSIFGEIIKSQSDVYRKKSDNGKTKPRKKTNHKDSHDTISTSCNKVSDDITPPSHDSTEEYGINDIEACKQWNLLSEALNLVSYESMCSQLESISNEYLIQFKKRLLDKNTDLRKLLDDLEANNINIRNGGILK